MSKPMLLVVEQSLPIKLSYLLDTYRSRLEFEGYRLTTVYFPKADPKNPLAHQELARSIVWPWVKGNPGGWVFLLGDLPLPKSGISTNPDGHTDTAGAYACTAYYAAPDVEWTDVDSNALRAPTKAAQVNVPGDGRFDQQSIPEGSIQAHVGYLNLGRLNARAFGSPLIGADWLVEVYGSYLQRNLDYRLGHWAPATLVGQGASTGNGAGWVAELGAAKGSYNNWGRDLVKAEAGAPYGVAVDFKTMDSKWTSREASLFSVINLTYGSYQIDWPAAALSGPLFAGSLATGSMGPSWNLSGAFEGKTLGELWSQTVDTGRPGGMIPCLYGDPTIQLPTQ